MLQHFIIDILEWTERMPNYYDNNESVGHQVVVPRVMSDYADYYFSLYTGQKSFIEWFIDENIINDMYYPGAMSEAIEDEEWEEIVCKNNKGYALRDCHNGDKNLFFKDLQTYNCIWYKGVRLWNEVR